MKLFLFGPGYSGRAVARALRGLVAGELAVAATVRDASKKAALHLEGIDAHLLDEAQPGTSLEAGLGGMTHLVSSVPPGAAGDPVLSRHRQTLLDAPDLKWLCYFSSLSVYGDHRGAWIDEDTACTPSGEMGRQRLAAEAGWAALAADKGVPLLILRLAGIYGPGRSALDRLEAGTARRIVKPGQVFNRIHRDDIGQITARAAIKRLSGLFNLGDDAPAPPQDVIAYAAELLGRPSPPETAFEDADLSAMAKSFYADNRRVSNARIKKALGVSLLYPSYREGLRAIHFGR